MKEKSKKNNEYRVVEEHKSKPKVTINNKLKITLTILLIVLISAISFGGIYIQNKNKVENIVPDYISGTDLTGARKIGIIVDDTKNKVIYDKDGKVVEKEGDGTTTKEEPVNPENVLTTENYEKVKSIVQKRLELMNVNDYTIGFNPIDGTIIVDMTDDSSTDTVAQYMYMQGKFEITDEDGNVLMNNSDIEKSTVKYGTTTSGTAVYLSIQFNKEGTQKLKDISSTYTKSTDEEGNDNSKKVKIAIDNSTFEATNEKGELHLSIGQASSSNATINENIRQASNLTVLLNSGVMPVKYTLDLNRYISSEIPQEVIYLAIAVIGVITLAVLLFMIIKYRKNGLLSAIAFVGYIAALLIVIRYTNVTLTLTGLLGILASIIINFVFTFYLLSLVKKSYKEKERIEIELDFNNAITRILFILIPFIIIAVILCFTKWLSLFSFGMVMFWGIIILLIYNIIITRTLIVNAVKEVQIEKTK